VTNVLDALGVLFADAPDNLEAVYDHVADQYDEFRKLWLRVSRG